MLVSVFFRFLWTWERFSRAQPNSSNIRCIIRTPTLQCINNFLAEWCETFLLRMVDRAQTPSSPRWSQSEKQTPYLQIFPFYYSTLGILHSLTQIYILLSKNTIVTHVISTTPTLSLIQAKFSSAYYDFRDANWSFKCNLQPFPIRPRVVIMCRTNSSTKKLILLLTRKCMGWAFKAHKGMGWTFKARKRIFTYKDAASKTCKYVGAQLFRLCADNFNIGSWYHF